MWGGRRPGCGGFGYTAFSFPHRVAAMGRAAVHYGNGRPKKGTSQGPFVTDAQDQQWQMWRYITDYSRWHWKRPIKPTGRLCLCKIGRWEKLRILVIATQVLFCCTIKHFKIQMRSSHLGTDPLRLFLTIPHQSLFIGFGRIWYVDGFFCCFFCGHIQSDKKWIN